MSGLSQEARALIDDVSDLDAPSAADKARIQQRLRVQLGAAAFAATLLPAATHSGASAASSASLAAPKGAWLGAVGKAVLSAAALGSLGLALWVGKGAPAAPREPTRAPDHAAAPPAEVRQQEVTRGAVAAPESPELAPTSVPELPKTHGRALLKPRAGAGAAQAPAAKQVDTLAEELALLGRAQAALRAGRATEAQSLAAEHRVTYPNGLMKEERMGVAALAECALSPENRAEAKAFLAAAANSPLAARVRKACNLP
jgi:hypothetical protein